MIEVEVSHGSVKAVDVAKNETGFEMDGWTPATDGPRLDRRVDATLAGSTTGLHFPDAAVSVEVEDGRGWTTFDGDAEPIDLPAGSHIVQIGTSIRVYVAFSGSCRLRRCGRDGTLSIAFGTPCTVTIGFRSHVDRPRETLTVPHTLDGSITALRYLSSAIDLGTPDKSYPTMRAHPPRIQFGPNADIPESIRREHERSDVTVSVPRSLADLLVAAPLIYYLRADIAAAQTSSVHVDAPTLVEPLALGTDRALETDVGALLRRVFYLDCLVRNAGPYRVDLQQVELVDELGLDIDAVYGQSEAARLARYLAVDFSAVTARLPDWHLSVVVDPTFESVQALPYVLAQMGLVQPANPVPVDHQTVITESVERSFVSYSRQFGTVPTYDIVRNETRLGTLQGWLADGTPVDAFRVPLDAFENRLEFHERSEGPRRVLVVINDEGMLDERAAVEGIYRSRSEELTMDVTVVESLSRSELADVFRSPIDFLHYIGHCDEGGLRCRDGILSTADIDGTTVQTFFLNACGSFDQGLELVRQGSVAGAVTLANVLNPEATRVGVTFARLLMHGFSIAHALSLASRHSITNKFYTVVGDGTHRLSQGEDTFPADLTSTQATWDEFDVRFNFPPLRIPGGLAKPAMPTDSAYVLRGSSCSVSLKRAPYEDFLTHVNLPVVHENEFYWSTELAERLGQRDNQASGRPVTLNHGRTNNN